MADMLAIHGWSHQTLLPTPSTTIRPSHTRSTSSSTRTPSPGKTISKARSTNALADMSVRSASATSKFDGPSETSLSTLRDPRVASTSDLSRIRQPSSHHPDLSNEVATLSDKLINAINNQTTLDDTLAETRQELETSRNIIQHLEAEAKKREEEIASGELVKWSDVEEDKRKLNASLTEERLQRSAAEKEKKNIEQELENLTAALFEEANKMVSAAKKEREAVERRNEQLRAQVQDTEMLLASHQEQLAELKMVMQQLTVDRDESDTRTNTSTTPSSPAQIQPQENIARLMGAMNLSPATPGAGDIFPGPSTSFSHLIKTVCRTDLQAFDDFRTLLQLPKNSSPPSRVASGSYGGLNVMGLAGLTGSSPNQNGVSNGSTASLSGPATLNSSPNGSSPLKEASNVPLKETRFYKRALTEDIEPTLRLDTAPGISWLTRRTVLNSICEGNLVVEPMPPASQKYAFPCSLCGERRTTNENCRTHRFRTSDSESAARYPLCMLCLEKVRSCCEFVGYLRLIKDGHIHAEDPEEEKEAWEETVRLRERMFWSRIGGGVVPNFVQMKGSEKTSSVVEDSPRPEQIVRDSCDQTTSPVSEIERPSIDQNLQVVDDPFKSDAKRVSIGSTIVSRKGTPEVRTPEPRSRSLSPNSGMESDAEAKAQLKNNLWDVLKSNGSPASKNGSPISKSPLAEREQRTERDVLKHSSPASKLGSPINKSLSERESRSERPVTPSRNGPAGEPRLKVKIPAVFGGPG